MTPEWVVKQRIGYFQSLIRSLLNSKDVCVSISIKTDCQTMLMMNTLEINGIDEQLTKYEKSISFLKKQLSLFKNRDSDTPRVCVPYQNQVTPDDIKEHVKIKDILESAGVEIHRGNKFKAIWRNDNNPSCDFNEDKNVFCDRGVGNMGGSIIDLYMKLYNCSLATAIKELSKLI